jgi:peptidoglycan hydrolase-like protein with peptidoglycan-binding domain
MPISSHLPACLRLIATELPVLSQGSTGSHVRVLQQLLNAKNFTLEITGNFDGHTQNAVREFQRLNALGISGIVDGRTWHCLSVGVLPFVV